MKIKWSTKALEQLRNPRLPNTPKIVPLDTELQKHLDGTTIQHPLYSTTEHLPMLNGIANKRLAIQRAAVTKARERLEWTNFVLLHEPPWRVKALQSITNELDDITYWPILADLWLNTDSIHEDIDTWRGAFNSRRQSNMVFLMTAAEQYTFNRLPNIITVYRGYNGRVSGPRGLSWTTSRPTALWHAARNKGPKDMPAIASGRVYRETVWAHFNRRADSEIVVDGDAVFDVQGHVT